MDKLSKQQKKFLLLRIFSGRFETWKNHAEWASKQFKIQVTDEEISAFYTVFLTSDFVPA